MRLTLNNQHRKEGPGGGEPSSHTMWRLLPTETETLLAEDGSRGRAGSPWGCGSATKGPAKAHVTVTVLSLLYGVYNDLARLLKEAASSF